MGEIFWAFSCFICCAERPTKTSPQIPPSLSLNVLSRLLWLKSQNFISASFWGGGRPTIWALWVGLPPTRHGGKVEKLVKAKLRSSKDITELPAAVCMREETVYYRSMTKSGARGPPQFLKTSSENSGSNSGEENPPAKKPTQNKKFI